MYGFSPIFRIVVQTKLKNMLDTKAVADLRTKYSGELARLEERQKSLDSQKTELMSKLGITSLDSFDIDAELAKTDGELERLSSELQAQIDAYDKLKNTEA